MSDAHAVRAIPHEDVSSGDRLEQAGFLATLGVAAALQFSIALAQVLLTVAVGCWLTLLVFRHERFEAPRCFWPLAGLAGMTLVSAAFSPQPAASFIDSRELVLYLIVPMAYRFFYGSRGSTLITVVISVGAASAAFGIFQYGILRYDNLGLRPRGTLGHYMTYSGLLMLVIGTSLARILFGRRDRLWPALVIPALAVAITLTFTRSAWVGACAAAALLLSLKDRRLIALLPIVAAVFIATAPANLTARFVSMFSLNDPTNRDRLAMLNEGRRMIESHPFVGVGPNMVQALYAEYRGADAVEAINPHLHNVPLQIAAERGLPAVAFWLWFVGITMVDLWRNFRAGGDRVPAAAAIAAMTSMLAAGLFEYNFGDSEFLMLLLLLITLPFAGVRRPAALAA